jgi:hypothetical protein
MIKYDLLVYLGLIPLVAVIIFAGFVICRTPADTDLETRKLRIADATLVGLLSLFIFTAILYFVDAEGAGEEISTKLLQSFLLWWARSDLPRLLAGWRSIPASSAPVEAEVRLRGSDGKYRWYLFLAHPSIGASDQVVKWYGFSTDIDDRKRPRKHCGRPQRGSATTPKQLPIGSGKSVRTTNSRC